MKDKTESCLDSNLFVPSLPEPETADEAEYYQNACLTRWLFQQVGHVGNDTLIFPHILFSLTVSNDIGLFTVY